MQKLPAKAIRTEVTAGALINDIAPYHRIAELHFEDRRSLETSVRTPEGQAMLEQALQISSGGKPHFLVMESDMAIDEEPGKPRPPIKCMVCFSQPEDKLKFDNAYFTEMLPAMLNTPAKQFKSYTVIGTIDNTESPFHRVLEFFFDSQAALHSCMVSAAGRALQDALGKVPTRSLLLVATEG